MQLLGLRQARPRGVVGVERRLLMRVLAVAQHAGAPPRAAEPGGQLLRGLLGGERLAHPARHRHVVLGGVPKCQRRQYLPLREREPARANGRQHAVVASRIDHHSHAGMVLRGGPHHRGSADVDLLDALVFVGAGGDCLAERVQVHHDQIEGLDAEFLQRGGVFGLAQIGEQSRMHARVQGLDTTVEHLGETRQLLHRGNRNTGGRNGFGG